MRSTDGYGASWASDRHERRAQPHAYWEFDSHVGPANIVDALCESDTGHRGGGDYGKHP